MASMSEPLSRNALVDLNTHYSSGLLPKSMPIVAVPVALHHSTASVMDTGPPSGASMAPPVRNSPNSDRMADSATPTPQEQNNPHQAANGLSNAPVGAAAAAQHPKVVQTAFIHKLYSMLEDHSIQHLISWSANNESFVMSPSSEFSKVLAQYFKHTNISSFVRQLNMYGFHKVSDVFHTAAPDSPLWEFKHGAGNFKRGDLVGLREIKRRASRHALIHRDSFSAAPKMPAPVPTGAPAETPHLNHEPPDSRPQVLDWPLNDLHHRLTRTEEAHHAMVTRYQVLVEGLVRCHHWNHELSSHLLALVPDPDNPVHREVFAMRQDIARHAETLRNMEELHEPSFVGKQPFFAQSSMAAAMEPSLPMSPRQRPFDDSRRSSLQATGKLTPFRAPGSSHLQVSPRRYGSIGAGNGLHSPFSRPGYLPPPPPPPQPQQPLHAPAPSSTSPLSLARRHTSADIRVHGWQAGQPAQHGSSPYASGQSSSAWPSSPRATMQPGDQQLREALSQYELPRASGMGTTNQTMGGSRQPSPPPYESGGVRDSFNNSGLNNRSGSTGPPSFNNVFGSSNHNNNNNNHSTAPSYANPNDAGWQLPGARFSFKGIDTPDSQTRRGSMASNVHSLLNPADTAEREGGDEGPDERKRKRLL